MKKNSYNLAVNLFNSSIDSKFEFLGITLGQLKFQIQKFYKEYHLNWEYLESLDNFKIEYKKRKFRKDNELKWVVPTEEEGFEFSPALPNKSLVIKTNRTLKILPKIKSKFFILIPIFLKIERGNLDKSLVFEKPTVPMSQSWFGNMEDGELGYHLNSSFYQEIKNIPSKYFQTICPLTIHNTSDEELSFDKLLLKSRYLNLYKGAESFWTNEVQVEYKDPNYLPQIKISTKVPYTKGGVKILTASRDKVQNNFVSNTFEKIKLITGF